MKQILELVESGTAERPIKGLTVDRAIYVYDTKQEILDEQAISNERVAKLVVWAKDIAKFMVFSADGSAYEEKDLPSGDVDLSDYAKLSSSNAFTAQQKIVNAEFKVEKSDGTNLLRVRTDNETVTVKGALTSDSIKTLALDIQESSTYTGSIDTDNSLVNKKYVDDSGGKYDGEGFGVPGRTETGHGTIIQTDITGNYRNTSNETGDLTINLRTDEGVTNFRLYYSMPHGTLSARKVYVKVDEKAGLNKTIRAGEIWLCQVKAGRFFDDFFWSKVTDGESTFALEETQLLAGMAGGQLYVTDLQVG